MAGSKISATLHTTQGDIRLTLFPDQAPKTVENFVGLAEGTKEYSEPNGEGGTTGPFYNGTIFHQVKSGHTIQGGDPTGTGQGGPGYKFADEFPPKLKFTRPYLLAMANSGPNTNGSRFIITLGALPSHDFRHTIFGEVADQESRDIVDAIALVETGKGDRPLADVVVAKVTIERS
ncbi:peptidylprolyl isomerase [Streptomyces sp. NPDC059874]|uniref:peptidylprolyl isomerase n=1 Tax=Streptomyces sp. NPDC059874 TaxID=3346983 RepID=UPI00366844AB